MEIEDLYTEIQPNIFAFFYVKTHNHELSEDLTQEVFYQAVKGFKSFQGNATVKTWVFAIAKNQLKKHYRTKHYRNELSEKLQKEMPISPSSEELFMQKEEQARILQLMEKLDEHSKEIVTLRTYGELSFKEISTLLNITENNARITFHRAKLKLQKELMKDEG